MLPPCHAQLGLLRACCFHLTTRFKAGRWNLKGLRQQMALTERSRSMASLRKKLLSCESCKGHVGEAGAG